MDGKVIKPRSRWRHYNGHEYTVLCVTNEEGDSANHPVMVVYQGDNGHYWSRPVDDFLVRMRPISAPITTAELAPVDGGSYVVYSPCKRIMRDIGPVRLIWRNHYCFVVESLTRFDRRGIGYVYVYKSHCYELIPVRKKKAHKELAKATQTLLQVVADFVDAFGEGVK